MEKNAMLTRILILLMLGAAALIGTADRTIAGGQAEGKGGGPIAQEGADEKALLDALAAGTFDQAIELAKPHASATPAPRLTHLVLGVDNYEKGQLADAEQHFRKAATGPIGELTSVLAVAWTKLAQGETQAALDSLTPSGQPDWTRPYLNFHRALMADAAGRISTARAAYQLVHEQKPHWVRIALAYAQHAAAVEDSQLAIKILDANATARREAYPLALDLRERFKAGEAIPLAVENPQQGLAEVFYVLGEALAEQEATRTGQAYLQIALRLRSDSLWALSALASAYERDQQYAAAIAAYDRIPPGTALQPAIDIRKALNLNSLDKVDAAKAILDRMAKENPTSIEPLDTLGNILRARERYVEAAAVYTRAIKLVAMPGKGHWSLFYARGTCHEQLGEWSKAEADLKKALELDPNQALILNYLGYFWIEQNKHLKEGLRLIEKAAKLRPEDGYVIDSLGWAHFKLENFGEAIRHLRRAHDLKPDEPAIADHLGDALLRAGSTEAARAHWQKALALKPKPALTEAIRKKLAEGGGDPAQTRPALDNDDGDDEFKDLDTLE
jgi:tetratricopeptide (TPR) repeat protein